MDMSAFTFLAGFLSSRAASAKPITVGERRRFYINRLGVMHTFFVFSAVFSLPAFFLRCGPGQCRQAEGMAGYWVSVTVQFLLFLTGFWPAILVAPFNPVAWYQANLYCFVLLFPPLDAFLRREFPTSSTTSVGGAGAARTLMVLQPTEDNHNHYRHLPGSAPTPDAEVARIGPQAPLKTVFACVAMTGAAAVAFIPMLFSGLFILNFLFVSWVFLFVAAMLAWRVHEQLLLPAVLARRRATSRTSQAESLLLVAPGDDGDAISAAYRRDREGVGEADDTHSRSSTTSGVATLLDHPHHDIKLSWCANPYLWAVLTDGLSLLFLYVAYQNGESECAMLPPKLHPATHRRPGGHFCFPDLQLNKMHC
mmetsp:Transcript_3862/g.9400  ORF Transcript_3862/g.9400 Transcript_3862/m.9400 type:complete len:366 (-) Transcript_3862:21-1118(-)